MGPGSFLTGVTEKGLTDDNRWDIFPQLNSPVPHLRSEVHYFSSSAHIKIVLQFLPTSKYELIAKYNNKKYFEKNTSIYAENRSMIENMIKHKRNK